MVETSPKQSPLVIAHFTVTGGNEAGVDLVLIQTGSGKILEFWIQKSVQTSLLWHVNHVFLMLSVISMHKKWKEVVPKQGQPQPHIQLKARILSPQL